MGVEVNRFTPTGVGTTCRSMTARSAVPVHPHGRGDNHRFVTSVCARSGSPPRAWGQRLASRGDTSGNWFTPTGVGTTRRSRPRSCTRAVHPHGRGDNAAGRPQGRPYRGSPPRAWGQRRRYRRRGLSVRFTPTGVGTTSSLALVIPSIAVHPHGRGDNEYYLLRNFLRDGSPPRAWGQLDALAAAVSALRFTPTGVGTTAFHARPTVR